MLGVLGHGFLGTRLAADLPGAVLLHVDITDRAAVLAALREHGCTAVVNAAGKTGFPNVDWCEEHAFETFRSNVTGALVVAEAAAELGAYLLHLGSGCIFYGPSPSPGGWREDDFANPVSLYSRSKYAADLMLSRLPNVGIARLRMPIDGSPAPRNLITKLVGYAQVIDVENSVTVVDDMVVAVRELVGHRAQGVFHVTNPGVLRHRELLEGYRELVDPLHRCELVDEAELEKRGLVRAARSNCILQSSRLAALGIVLRPVHEALRDVLTRYAAARKGIAQVAEL
jgi:dTDP-4-dehydrorhamnose reductase